MPNDASDKYIANRNPTARISPIFRDGDVLARYSATARISPIFRDGDVLALYSATATRRTATKICERYSTLNGRNFKKF